MAFKELIKNFELIRNYMREFYVYGFKTREGYDRKSSRLYDDEKRRIESWLQDYMRFEYNSVGKRVFLSVDSRQVRHNPLYKAWKAKSFTDGDITLHFILFDILYSPEVKRSLNEIMQSIDKELAVFENPHSFEISTVRKKLNEYIGEGLVNTEKRGNKLLYARTDSFKLPNSELLNFYSEIAPCGVIGSFLIDKGARDNYFIFKHHYITQTIDSEILLTLLEAIQTQRAVTIKTIGHFNHQDVLTEVVPIKLYFSVQNGRQYLMAWSTKLNKISAIRLDRIEKVRINEVSSEFNEGQIELGKIRKYLWGVGTNTHDKKLEHVEFTVQYNENEKYILQRLLREKRQGVIKNIDKTHSTFSIDLFDSVEIIPWIRTFIGRITNISFSNPKVANRFNDDLNSLYRLYEIEGDQDVI